MRLVSLLTGASAPSRTANAPQSRHRATPRNRTRPKGHASTAGAATAQHRTHLGHPRSSFPDTLLYYSSDSFHHSFGGVEGFSFFFAGAASSLFAPSSRSSMGPA